MWISYTHFLLPYFVTHRRDAEIGDAFCAAAAADAESEMDYEKSQTGELLLISRIRRVLLKNMCAHPPRERSSHVTFSFVTLDYRLHGGRISWVILWIINLKLRDSARRNFFDWLALCENERKKTPAMLMRKHDARELVCHIIQISADHADDELLITPLNGSRAQPKKSSSFTFV